MPPSKPDNKNQPARGELFLVATPIGNLADITLRALETLKSVDRIACEDTRTSYVLLKHYGIKAPLSAYHSHNEAAATDVLVADLLRGQRIALISDAGTPLLSDPGARLVAAAIAAGIRVTPIPGASALLAAVTMAGLPAGQFFYGGFLPTKSALRKAALAALVPIPATVVLYEAPHRLLETLEDLHASLGDRTAAVARELTKMHEECVRGSLREIIAHFTATSPRGECVILVEGAPALAAMDDAAIDDALRDAMRTQRLKDAVAAVALGSGRAKSDVYARALALKDGA
jgi:16S rRNA (cytidine1402-2'-O)-methyltransferase